MIRIFVSTAFWGIVVSLMATTTNAGLDEDLVFLSHL